MKFIHCADVHLDSPLLGLSKTPSALASQLRVATRQAFENVVEAAITNKVDFLLIAGDLYDVGLTGFESALFFNRQAALLHNAGIRVFLIYGNHDAATKLVKNLHLPPNVTVLSEKHPQTEIDEKLGIAIHGQSFAKQAVSDDLASSYPPALKGAFNIGLLHTNLGGDPNHDNYAPCSLDTLVNKGYDYWALGHVHTRRVLHEAPWVVYSGNTQGRQVRESGEKSCELVTVDGNGRAELERVPTAAVPWVVSTVNIGGSTTMEDVLQLVTEQMDDIVRQNQGRTVALRIEIKGVSSAHTLLIRDEEKFRAEVQSLAYQSAGDQLWIERIVLESAPLLNLDELAVREDPIGELLRLLKAVRNSPESLNRLAVGLKGLKTKLPGEIAAEINDSYLLQQIHGLESSLVLRLSEIQGQQ